MHKHACASKGAHTHARTRTRMNRQAYIDTRTHIQSSAHTCACAHIHVHTRKHAKLPTLAPKYWSLLQNERSRGPDRLLSSKMRKNSLLSIPHRSDGRGPSKELPWTHKLSRCDIFPIPGGKPPCKSAQQQAHKARLGQPWRSRPWWSRQHLFCHGGPGLDGQDSVCFATLSNSKTWA